MGDVADLRFPIWELRDHLKDLKNRLGPLAASEAALMRDLTGEVIGLAQLLSDLIPADVSFGDGDHAFYRGGRWELATALVGLAVQVSMDMPEGERVFEFLADLWRRSLEDRMRARTQSIPLRSSAQ
jgi:hypothetical protein